MDYKDYYATLGVDRKTPAADIQKAYRKLARKLHPDVNKTPEAEARFKEITEAYEVLKDKDKRAKYDQFGSAWKQAQSTGAPPQGFEDIFSAFGRQGGSQRGGRGGFQGSGGDGTFSSFFEALFGGGDPGAGGGFSWSEAGARQRAQPASDHEASISLSLEEAAQGGARQITLTDPATGRQRTLEVKIPAGVRTGQKIRLAGQGGGAGAGGRRGDLFLRVELLPHRRFRLDGDRLFTELAVTPAEAALGGEAAIQTLDGELRVRIPAGSSSGRKIRLRGKGFPAAKGAAGDLIAEVRVVVPTELSDAERDLYQQLSDLSDGQRGIENESTE